MDILVDVFLPLSLAVIMLSVGIGLAVADFTHVIERKAAFLIGASLQLVLIPVAAYAVIMIFNLEGEIALGVMLIALCPGGVTSNAIAKIANADVALSVSLTAVMSLLSMFTVPLLISWAALHFLSQNAPDVSIAKLATALFLITTLPVAIGMLVRAKATNFANRIEHKLTWLAGLLFLVIVVAAVTSQWPLFVKHFFTLAPAIMSLNVFLLFAALAVSLLLGLAWRQSKTIAIEVGIQNGTLGVTLAPMVVAATTGIPATALPPAIYGVTMYFVAVPFVWWLRRH